MKKIMRSLKWHKLILVSLFMGGLLGAFNIGLFTPTVSGLPDCPDGEQCRRVGCDPPGQYCVYQNIYGNDGICPQSMPCDNVVL